MKTRKEIFKKYLKDYMQARESGGRCTLSGIITIVSEVTGMHRKSVLRAFARSQCKYPSSVETRGSKVKYTADCTYALHEIWKASHKCCGDLLFPMIPEYVAIFQRDHMWEHSEHATELLLQMKKSTVKRRISSFGNLKRKGKGFSTTKPSQLKHIIPIFHGEWRGKLPGTGQIDTVANCGHTVKGDFVYSLQYIDVPLYWTIIRAQWNKGQSATLASLEYIKARLPWKIIGMHPDTGSEFINWLVKEWCDTVNIDLTRSRPGHSNDNAYVEERNGNIIRKYLGYTRFDCKESVEALNDVYEVLCVYLNHFIASKRIVRKYEVKGKWKTEYEKIAKTPYQRVMAHKKIPKAVKNALTEEHEKLNPLILLREIERRTKVLYDIQRKYGNTNPEITPSGG